MSKIISLVEKASLVQPLVELVGCELACIYLFCHKRLLKIIKNFSVIVPTFIVVVGDDLELRVKLIFIYILVRDISVIVVGQVEFNKGSRVLIIWVPQACSLASRHLSVSMVHADVRVGPFAFR